MRRHRSLLWYTGGTERLALDVRISELLRRPSHTHARNRKTKRAVPSPPRVQPTFSTKIDPHTPLFGGRECDCGEGLDDLRVDSLASAPNSEGSV